MRAGYQGRSGVSSLERDAERGGGGSQEQDHLETGRAWSTEYSGQPRNEVLPGTEYIARCRT